MAHPKPGKMQVTKNEETQEKQNEAEKEREAWPQPGLITPLGSSVLTTVSSRAQGILPLLPRLSSSQGPRVGVQRATLSQGILSGNKVELGDCHFGGVR